MDFENSKDAGLERGRAAFGGDEHGQKLNAAPGEGFLGLVEGDESEKPSETPKIANGTAPDGKFDGKKLAEPRPCPKCGEDTVLVDTTTGLCKGCFDKEPKNGDDKLQNAIRNSAEEGVARGAARYGAKDAPVK